ncbi:uncharacterized protein LOC116413806 [Galleria mellonella]|uniref:Uncharacterized protein LOC116413806 n=1 Tax=Galleria mellonella TaxID=7137 RepID=A0A6J3CDU5_GALME|nr:uncharacterized protein LOC116413806 [Galleria mellonella]
MVANETTSLSTASTTTKDPILSLYSDEETTAFERNCTRGENRSTTIFTTITQPKCITNSDVSCANTTQEQVNEDLVKDTSTQFDVQDPFSKNESITTTEAEITTILQHNITSSFVKETNYTNQSNMSKGDINMTTEVQNFVNVTEPSIRYNVTKLCMNTYPKECNRPLTWETTLEGESRDFFQILKSKFGRRARWLRDTTQWPRRSNFLINEKNNAFIFGDHNET